MSISTCDATKVFEMFCQIAVGKLKRLEPYKTNVVRREPKNKDATGAPIINTFFDAWSRNMLKDE